MVTHLPWEQVQAGPIPVTPTKAAHKRRRDAGLEIDQHQGDPEGRRQVLQTSPRGSVTLILHESKVDRREGLAWPECHTQIRTGGESINGCTTSGTTRNDTRQSGGS